MLFRSCGGAQAFGVRRVIGDEALGKDPLIHRKESRDLHVRRVDTARSRRAKSPAGESARVLRRGPGFAGSTFWRDWLMKPRMGARTVIALVATFVALFAFERYGAVPNNAAA